MTSLWRTERPRFPMYSPDGRGRDYYIKFDNGGYWADQFQISKKPDYERPHYRNFHTLYHEAAPFKYWGNGHGRETYIIKGDGFFHEKKPLCSYKLSDFLRVDSMNSLNNKYKHKLFMSVSEKKYNNKLRQLEKKIIYRLYTEPMNIRRSLTQIKNNDKSPTDKMRKTFTGFYPRKKKGFNDINSNNYCYTEVFKDTNDYPSIKNNTLENENKANICLNIKNKNSRNKIITFNRTCNNFYKKNLNPNKHLELKPENDFHFGESIKTFKNLFDYNNKWSTINTIRHENDLRFIAPKNINNKAMKVEFKFKPKPKSDKIKIKKIKIS